MKVFYKNKGTISVFLTLILVPVLLVGGMTADASRIYMAKTVISDAGEMAMNAGLARYNEELHDEYGMLVMDQPPEAVAGELEAYFNGSLSGAELPDAEDYNKLLDLMTENFEALNVQGSEIYRTEVEKQQILEYMKYRAPVCLTELVLKKINELKDTKKMAEAMEAEMDFSEDMKDCQDAFEDAKITLDALDQAINNFPSSHAIEEELANTQKDYKEIVSRCLLMRSAIQKYDKKSSDKDMKKMAELYIKAAKQVDLSTPYSANTFNKYINSQYYKNTVNALGKIDKLLKDYDDAKSEQADKESDSETNSGQQENSGETETADDTGRKELEDIVKKYKEQEKRIEGYLNILLSTANDTVSGHTAALSNYWSTAKSAEQAARAATNRLDVVKQKLKKAKESFDKWDSKNGELKAVGKNTESMDQEVEKYREFFSNGDGKADLEQLEHLLSDVQEDQNYFGEWKKLLEKEKFFGQSIVSVQASAQVNKYRSEADSAVVGAEAQYSSLEQVRGNYIKSYEHINPSNSYSEKPIHNDPFYLKIQEYCNAQNETQSTPEENEANNKLNQSKAAGEEANKENDYPEFDWTTAGVTLPSTLTGGGASTADGKLTNLDSGGSVKDDQKNVIAKFRESIRAAVSFLDAVDRIAAKGAENLYIAEYAMQMFSYYTVGLRNGQERPDGEIIGISGYSLKEHKAYRAECEYILWGKTRSQANVKSTVMMLFGIRMLFNSFFAFTDKGIEGLALSSATAIAGGWAPYLIPIIKVIIKLGFAGVETASDISKLKQGYGVIIFKNSNSWSTAPYMRSNTDNRYGMTFDYSEYLRVFLNISMLAGNETGILGRIADCIQVNEPDMNLQTGYTMISVQAKVKSRTTFMRKISDFGEGGTWGFPDDTYTISYQSILGY